MLDAHGGGEGEKRRTKRHEARRNKERKNQVGLDTSAERNAGQPLLNRGQAERDGGGG